MSRPASWILPVLSATLLGCGQTFTAPEPLGSIGQQSSPSSLVIGAMYHHWYRANEWKDNRYAPLLGQYDSSDPEVVRQHVAWARQAGINTFVIDAWINDSERWWMDRNTPPALDVLDAAGLKYFFIADGWFRYSGSDPGGYDAHAIAANVNANLAHYFGRPGYLKVEGKPVIFFWATDGSECALWDKVRAGIEGTIGPVYLTGFNDEARCFDKLMYYNPYTPLESTWAGQLEAQPELWKAFQSKKMPWAPTAMPGYDDTNARPGNPPIPLDPESFRQSLRIALRHAPTSGDRWVFVCSFNEWWEGSNIEPTTDFADPYVFLDVMRQELSAAGWVQESSPGPAPGPGPGPSACDPVSQPAPHWGERGGACLPSCGALGGTVCSASASCPSGHAPVSGGPSFDCQACCAPASSQKGCDPGAQPAPHWQEVGGACLPSCGVAGGTYCAASGGCPAGATSVGPAHDCAVCCG